MESSPVCQDLTMPPDLELDVLCANVVVDGHTSSYHVRVGDTLRLFRWTGIYVEHQHTSVLRAGG
jgi:hypothetical protein